MNVRLADVWNAIAARLATPETETILSGGRVYQDYEDYSVPPAGESIAWGRQIVRPTGTLWPVSEISDLLRPVSFLLVSEMNDVVGPPGYPSVALEKLQDIGYTQLHHWWPDPVDNATVVLWVFRERPPQAMPQWDPDNKLWWMSSEYRFEAARRN